MAYRRSIILINKRFQLKYSFYVVSWLFALSFVYPLIIYNIFEHFIRYAALDPMGPPIQMLQATRKEMLWLLVFMQILFLLVTFLISIFVSHRIAGPIYKLKKTFEEVAAGQFTGELYFRKRDHFQDLTASFNQMMSALRSGSSTSISKHSEAIQHIENALASVQDTAGPAKKELEQALAALGKSS